MALRLTHAFGPFLVVLLIGSALCPARDLSAALFVRGDVDMNGSLEMADAVQTLGYLFLGAPRSLLCPDAADANDSGNMDVSDGVYILAHLFLGSPEPPAPFPACGPDPTGDSLDCGSHAFCPAPFCERSAFEEASIDVGGHSLRFRSQGQGCPGIVLDAGLGDSGMASFSGLLPLMAAISRILVYDRAGLGASQPGPEPRTPQQIVTELHTLLVNVDFEPPYVLVGHSMGGHNIRAFAEMYPDEVAGMVFVDASHEYFWNQWAERYPASWDIEMSEAEEYYAGLPRGVQLEWEAFRQARHVNPGPIPDVPIVVLTALNHGFPPELEMLVNEAHEILTRSVTNGTHISLPGVGHYIHQERPQVVIDAIRQIVEGGR